MAELRRSCRWFLRYAGWDFCRRDAFQNAQSPMKRLDLGCDCNLEADYQPQKWKEHLYPETPSEKKVVEWEDEP